MEIKEKVLSELCKRCGFQSTDQIFTHIGTANYREKYCETAEAQTCEFDMECQFN